MEFHPTARAFLAEQKTPASFATITYYGAGSFKFINAKGEGHYVRYQLVPDAGEQLLTDEEREKQSANYLMEEIKARVAAAPIGFTLFAQVAEHGDRINDNDRVARQSETSSSWQARNQDANSKHSRRGQKARLQPRQLSRLESRLPICCPVFIRRHSDYQRKRHEMSPLLRETEGANEKPSRLKINEIVT